jgi:hypothetical protein
LRVSQSVSQSSSQAVSQSSSQTVKQLAMKSPPPAITLTEQGAATPKSILKIRTNSLDDDTSSSLLTKQYASTDYEEGISDRTGNQPIPIRKRTASFEDGFDDEFDRSSSDGDNDYEQPAGIRRIDSRESTSVHYRRGRRDFNFLLDKPESMTYSRRLAIYLMKYNWYYPQDPTDADNGADDKSSTDDLDDLYSMDTASVMSFSIHKSTAFRKASLGT